MVATRYFGRLCAFAAIVFALAARAQDESLADIRYNEDYQRLQKIIKISDPLKRAEQMLDFYKGRSDIDPNLLEYADNYFARDLDSLKTQSSFSAMRSLSERAIKMRPKFGEAYFFYGVALRYDRKLDEAINAFAKCFVIPNLLQNKAKEMLDSTYRSAHKGSLVGQDKIISNARKELK